MASNFSNMRVAASIVTVLSAITVASAAAAGPDLRLVIDRQETSIEVFAALDADDSHGIFGTDASGLAAEDGRIYYGAFRKTGTYDFASDLISGVSMTVDGKTAELDAMSVMVHPDDLILPFVTPFDAVLAMSVCNVNDPDSPPTLDSLRLYSGFVAYPVEGWEAFSLNLPATVPLEIEVTTYVDSANPQSTTYSVMPGEALVFDEADRPGWFSSLSLAKLFSN